MRVILGIIRLHVQNYGHFTAAGQSLRRQPAMNF
jgi:hypothetical protein